MANPVKLTLQARHAWPRLSLTTAVMVTATLAGCASNVPNPYRVTQPVKTIELRFNAVDGSKLRGSWLPAAQNNRQACTLVHAPSTAGDAKERLAAVSWLPQNGVNVLSFDYRGLGQSEGRPSLNGMVADVHAAVEAASRQPAAQGGNVLLFGQGLGAASAIRAVQRMPKPPVVRSLLIDSSFASYRSAARDVPSRNGLGWLAAIGSGPVPFENEDPLALIKTMSVPVWIIHGTADNVVPVSDADALFKAAPEPKYLLKATGATHLGTLTRPADQAAFLQAVKAMCSLGPMPPV